TLYSLLSIKAYHFIIESRSHSSLLPSWTSSAPSMHRLGLSRMCSRPSLAWTSTRSAALPSLSWASCRPSFSLVVKNGRRGVARRDESMEVFWRVDGVNVLVDLVVGGSGRARENTTVAQLNLVKSGRDKAMGDVREVDGVEATIRPLASIDCRVNARGKKKIEVLLRVLESEQGSQL
ncbi:U-box domain-containing protein, partial [Musa troglodytarum]